MDEEITASPNSRTPQASHNGVADRTTTDTPPDHLLPAGTPQKQLPPPGSPAPPNRQPTSPPARRIWLWLILGIVLVLIAIWAWYKYSAPVSSATSSKSGK